MRQSSGKIEGLGKHGVASAAMALVTVVGTVAVSSGTASGRVGSMISMSALLAKRDSCFALKRWDLRISPVEL